MARRIQSKWSRLVGLLLAGIILAAWAGQSQVLAADAPVEYPGTVVMVDAAAGKLAVKKEGGSTRFTFVVNDKTQFDGGAKSLKDLKKDDKVTVSYVVNGSQYLAQKIAKK